MNIIIRVLNFSIMIALPVCLAVFLARKHKTAWGLFGIGAGTFIVSQIFHIPFNHWVLEPALARLGLSLNQQGLPLAAVGLFYGASAGIFEEVARAIGYRWWIREDRSWEAGLMFGAGHGGIEAILLGALAMFAFVRLMALRGADLSTLVPLDQVELAEAQIKAYWALPWHQAILGAVERGSALLIQLSLSILVLQTFRRKQPGWLFLAIGWHTLVDAAGVYAIQTWSVYTTELIVGIFGLVSVAILFALRSGGNPSIAEDKLEPLSLVEIQPVIPSTVNLEDSRYESSNE